MTKSVLSSSLPLARSELISLLNAGMAPELDRSTFRPQTEEVAQAYKAISFSEKEFRRIWAHCFHSLRVSLVAGEFNNLDPAIKKPRLFRYASPASKPIGVQFLFPYDPQSTGSSKFIACIRCEFGALKDELKVWPIVPEDFDKINAFTTLRMKISLIEWFDWDECEGTGDNQFEGLQSYTLRYTAKEGAYVERLVHRSSWEVIRPQFLLRFLGKSLLGVRGIYAEDK